MQNPDGLHIKRYPASSNKSLQAWSAADEHLLKHVAELEFASASTITYGDRFGFLACHLKSRVNYLVTDGASQRGAITKNLTENKVEAVVEFLNPLQNLEERITYGLMKIPKSIDLFELYLHHFTQNASSDSQLLCGFMTRHFSPQMLHTAERYFSSISQSRAWKKSRLLVLKNPIQHAHSVLTNDIVYNNEKLTQYFGVFSSKKVDPASQFLLEHLPSIDADTTVMDLGCGNGILGGTLAKNNSGIQVHLIDDSYLAIESAKLNFSLPNTTFHHAYTLTGFDQNSVDLIVSNPPFHIEYEIDISLPLRLFKEAFAILKVGGILMVVANNHLNYSTHLNKLFSSVEQVEQNDKYSILTCTK